jgi:hypothetical protein
MTVDIEYINKTRKPHNYTKRGAYLDFKKIIKLPERFIIIITRRWCNSQHGCLPSSRSGFNSLDFLQSSFILS